MKNKLTLLTIIAIALILGSCTSTPPEEAVDDQLSTTATQALSNEEIGYNFVDDLISGNYGEASNDYKFSPQMQTVVSESFFEQTMATLSTGDFVEMKKTYSYPMSGYVIVTTALIYTDNKFNMNVVFAEEIPGEIAGLNIGEYSEAPEEEAELNNNFQEINLPLTVNGMELGGTLTVPAAKAPFPCVILVHGSGPNDRDETIYTNKPFRDIAQGLAARGIASYRYDKSTYAHPEMFQSNFNMTLEDETVNDAAAIFNLVKGFGGIDAERVYILGHSLGGYAIPLIAEKTMDAAGYIIMAGSTRPLEILMAEQVTYLVNQDGDISDQEQVALEYYDVELTKLDGLSSLTEADFIFGIPVAYWNFLADYSPLARARTIGQPVLVLQGLRDYQVTVTDFNGWKDNFDGHANWSFQTYETLNHLMMTGEGEPNPSEYTIASKVSDEVLDDIADWIE